VYVECWFGGTDGSPGTESTGTSFRFHTADTPTTADTSTPIPIPTADFNYSYWVHLCLTISGSFTKVNNIRHYSDGTIGWNLGTSGELRRGNRDAGDKGCAKTDYDVATGTSGTTGHSIEDDTNGHGYYDGQSTETADVASDTSGSPATIDSSDIETTADSKAIVLQVKVDTDATQGAQAAETLTFKYDEI